jgi:hypothetical protein
MALPVARASNADLAYLAMDGGPVPEQFGALLTLDGDVGEPELGERIAGIPRLRERLYRARVGRGRPFWAADPAFAAGDHVARVRCAPPGDQDAVLDTAITHVTCPLPRDRPLWRAVIVDGLAGGGVAVLIVVHHCVTDGLGGLSLLARLADTAAAPPAPVAPSASLARRAFPMPRSIPTARTARPARVARVARADLAAVRAAAHQRGGTVHALILAAAAGALGRRVAGSGDRLDEVAIAVPVATRSAAAAGGLGNAVTFMLLRIPAAGDLDSRVRRAAAEIARHRAVTGPPPIATLGPLFRVLARWGVYRWYMNRQRRAHTIVTYVHGPDRPIALCGRAVRSIVPVSVGESGNIAVSFQALSYAGTLTLTTVADPDRCPGLPAMVTDLRACLGRCADRPEGT